MMYVRSWKRAGPLVPPGANGLKAGAVRLAPDATMAWHSTRQREELLIILAGRVQLQVRRGARAISRKTLNAGQCVFVPQQTMHQVVNRSRTAAIYIYVTAPVV